jgi:signal transduction histidine kinase
MTFLARRAFALVALAVFFLLEASAGELQTAAEVRSLTSQQATERVPVHLRGVVTFFDENLFSRFIQDETAGIYLQFPAGVGPPLLLPGQTVEVFGAANPGEYAPVVMVDKLEVTGKGELPAAKLVTYAQLATGADDSQFIEISGIVRAVRAVEKPPFYQIDVTTGGGRLLVFAKTLPVAHADELIDSTVRVRGVCSTQFNQQRQLFAIRLMVPRPEDLQIETPASEAIFTAAPRPIDSLLQFTPQESSGHRVKLAGAVIYFEPGAGLFLQDGNHGVEVQTKERAQLQLGDRVEALGFVGQGVYTPVLQDAIYRKISAGTPVAPARLTVDEALKGRHDCQLIQVAARLIDRTQQGNEQFLVLQESNFIFQASFKQAVDGRPVILPANGSRVAVTGVCRIEPGKWEAGENWRAKSFDILLRSPADVELLQAPPWWTLRKVLWISAALGFALLAAFGWVAVLRRQVSQRTRELEIQIQKRQMAERRREIEQERTRVAHDLHDDLGSRLTEVNMLASLAKSPTTSPAEKEQYLTELTETARAMVTSLDEIVWAVNPRNDTIASLASYFGAYAQRFLELASISCGLDVAENLPEHPLDTKFRQEIFFAFKEALTNIVRHAQATQVWLRISVPGRRLVVELADNGRGFGLSAPAAGSDGLVNMKERLQTLGGECEITGNPEAGTTVRLAAPLPEKLS